MTRQTASKSTPKWLWPAVAISALLLVILFALGILGGGEKTPPGNTASHAESLPNGAGTMIVGKQAASNTLSWQGSVRSRLVVKIAPKLNARIIDLPVHPGDRLKKGEIIARLDDRDMSAAYNAAYAASQAAQAQAQQAISEERRISDLFTKQAATRQNYDAVLAQSHAAQAIAHQAAAAARQSQVLLGENILYAPFDGVVAERLQEPGDMGMPNQTMVTFMKPDDLRLETAISDRCTTQIKLGMPVKVRVDAIQQTFNGVIDEIEPELDPQTRTQQIKIDLPKAIGLQHGQFGWVELSCQEQQQSLLIPATAVLHYGQLQAVKVVEDGQLHVRHIRTGKQYGEQLEVLSGLQAGESILVNVGMKP